MPLCYSAERLRKAHHSLLPPTPQHGMIIQVYQALPLAVSPRQPMYLTESSNKLWGRSAGLQKQQPRKAKSTPVVCPPRLLGGCTVSLHTQESLLAASLGSLWRSQWPQRQMRIDVPLNPCPSFSPRSNSESARNHACLLLHFSFHTLHRLDRLLGQIA